MDPLMRILVWLALLKIGVYIFRHKWRTSKEDEAKAWYRDRFPQKFREGWKEDD